MAESKSRTAPKKDAELEGKAEAAQAENNGKPKTIEFEGLTLRLPARLPFKVLRHLRNQREAAGSDIYGILETIIGVPQTDQLCELEIDGEPFDVDQGVQLLTDVLAEYGVTMGESEASQSS